MLEILYSSGLRRMELLHLKLYDVDQKHGLVTVRQGKGKRDRVVPIGQRALAWLDLYLNSLRPEIAKKPDDGIIFLTSNGVSFTPNHLSWLARQYVKSAAIRQERRVPYLPPYDGDTDARRRSGYPLHSSHARPRAARYHPNLHPCLDPQAEAGPRGHSPRSTS